MVLIAAAICSKEGKALVSRQFVEMSKSRIEGLIATFPKLIDSGKQHTFIETDSVRYVYQPLERMYVLLITTKASNILEDLETLRLFARVIPEYARGSEVCDVVENAFQLIFAFDEIVALGYRETVSISQIRTFTEMDSHEERMFNAVRETQEKEAKDMMRKRARELQQARIAAAKQGISPTAALANITKEGFDAISMQSVVEPHVEESFGNHVDTVLSSSHQQVPVRRGGMQLGGRSGPDDMDKLVVMLQNESPVTLQTTTILKPSSDSPKSAVSAPVLSIEKLHVRMEEKLTLKARRDGGLETMELAGVLNVRANDETVNNVCLLVNVDSALAGTKTRPPAAMQTHPNIDKKLFVSSSWLQPKQGGKSYPIGQEVGVLKWRLQTQDEAFVPVVINCWPNEIPGGYEVNIEYELQDTSLSLLNFCVNIPLPPGSKPPLIGSCDGDYELKPRESRLLWTRPVVDADNLTGSLDFTIKADHGADFFPIQLEFASYSSFCGVQVLKATNAVGEPVKVSSECFFRPEHYLIV